MIPFFMQFGLVWQAKWLWTGLLLFNTVILVVLIFITEDRQEIRQATTYPTWKPLAQQSRGEYNYLYMCFVFQFFLVIIQTKFILQ